MCIYHLKEGFKMNEEQESEPLESVQETIEKGMKEKTEADGLDLFDIEITNESRGITVRISCEDGSDALFISSFVLSAFKKLDVQATSKIMGV
jgi:hypothetical protein